MTAIAYRPIPEERRLPAPAKSAREVAWWGMALLCASEAALFAYLIFSYFYLGLRETAWPPAEIEKPKLFLPLMMTLVLLSSSVTLWWGERGIKQGKQGRLRTGLVLSILIGIGFLFLQWREYHEKLRHFTPKTHAYTSLFFTITSLHGAHVAFGILIMCFTMARAMRGHFDGERHTGVSVTSLYWHFVDAVWLFIVAAIYVSPHLY